MRTTMRESTHASAHSTASGRQGCNDGCWAMAEGWGRVTAWYIDTLRGCNCNPAIILPYNDMTSSLIVVCNRIYSYFRVPSHTGPYPSLHYDCYSEIGYVSHAEFAINPFFQRVTACTKTFTDLEKQAIIQSIPLEKSSRTQFYVAIFCESEKTLQGSVVVRDQPRKLISGTQRFFGCRNQKQGRNRYWSQCRRSRPQLWWSRYMKKGLWLASQRCWWIHTNFARAISIDKFTMRLTELTVTEMIPRRFRL
jgi:hypothetical protein